MDDDRDAPWYRYRRTIGTTLAGPWMMAWVASTILLDHLEVSRAMRVAIALVPLPFFGWFVWRFLQHVRKADELERRIQMESLAIAFPLSIAMVMALGLLEHAGVGFEYGWSMNALWISFFVFYLFGRNLARRRYM